MSLLPEAVKQFILKYEKFLLLGHAEPDGDCISSQLVLAALLRRIGKEAHLFSPGPFDRPEIHSYGEFFRERITAEDIKGDTAAVILDCSTPDRLGNLGEAVADLPVLVIDHHSSGKEYGTIRWVITIAPSVTYLIQLLIEGLGLAPTVEEAKLLLFGLLTDTGFFRHLTENSSAVFSAVSRLVAAGASPNAVYRLIYGEQELARLKLLARSLLNVETYFEGRLILSHHTLKDLEELNGSIIRGSDELYRLLQTVKGGEVVVYIRKESAGLCSVGLRSNNEFDVGAIAKSLGGGGHKKAAGFTFSGHIEEIKKKLLRIIAERLKS